MHTIFTKRCLFLIVLLHLFFCSAAFGAEQIVYPQPASISAASGDQISFDVYYETSNNNASLSGLGLRLHWNSAVLELIGLSEVLTDSLFLVGEAEADTENRDNDASTDKFVNTAWLDIGTEWPGVLPARLFRASFRAIGADTTRINFSASATAGGYMFSSSSLQVDITGEPSGIGLSTGWNLISLYRQPPDTGITAVLNTIATKYHSVWAYTAGDWQVYDPTNPGLSDLSNMAAGSGYWINMRESGVLAVSGAAPPNATNLTSGWNLVGFNSETVIPVENALASIMDKVISVWAYGNGQWKVYDPANPGLSDLPTMEPGYGYWINTTQACTWTLP